MTRYFFLLLMFSIGCDDASKDTAGEQTPIVPTTDQTWWIDLSTAEVVEPEGGDGILSLIDGDYSVLASAQNVQEGGMNLLLALAGDDQTQDLCNRTVQLENVSLEPNGEAHFGPADFTIANGILTEDLEVMARFSEDLQGMNEITLKGAVRLSTIPEDMLPLGGLEPCTLLESIEIACEPCKDGEVDCLNVHTAGLAGVLQAGVSLEAVDEADAHEDCEVGDSGA